jgi:hypothetical protein
MKQPVRLYNNPITVEIYIHKRNTMDITPTQGKTCSCGHHKVVPTLIVLFGLLFLLAAFDVVGARVVEIVWPILVIIGGIMKFGEGKCKCC